MATFDNLSGERFINLTTFRRNGTPVVTPVWSVLHDGKLTIMTLRPTGKVKRIHNRADVLVAPATLTGKPTGPDQAGKARVLDLVSMSPPFRALARKYGWQFSVFRAYQKLRRADVVLVEIEPA
jgi:uncharacterized protein